MKPDFVAKMPEFQNLANDIAKHRATIGPEDWETQAIAEIRNVVRENIEIKREVWLEVGH